MTKEWTREEIISLRRKYRINQEALARIVGVRGQQAVSDWETGLHSPGRLCKRLLTHAEETLFILFEREAKKDYETLKSIILHRYGVETKIPPRVFSRRKQ